MGPIQVIPPGLMGLLQLKQEGRLPGDLSEQVVPVIELRDWYLTARRLDDTALFGVPLTLVTSTGGQGFQILNGPGGAAVPQEQIWYVEQYSLDVIIGTAADTIRIAPAIFNNQHSSWSQVGPDAADVVNARSRVLSCKADRGFWAFPGDLFGLIVFDVSSASLTVHGRIRATPCPI